MLVGHIPVVEIIPRSFLLVSQASLDIQRPGTKARELVGLVTLCDRPREERFRFTVQTTMLFLGCMPF